MIRHPQRKRQREQPTDSARADQARRRIVAEKERHCFRIRQRQLRRGTAFPNSGNSVSNGNGQIFRSGIGFDPNGQRAVIRHTGRRAQRQECLQNRNKPEHREFFPLLQPLRLGDRRRAQTKHGFPRRKTYLQFLPSCGAPQNRNQIVRIAQNRLADLIPFPQEVSDRLTVAERRLRPMNP